MKPIAFASGTAFLALCASSARAQDAHINEIYASHSGTDTEEYYELKGTPGASLAGYMLLYVEGNQTAGHNEGKLKKAYDLSTFSMPASGFFVIGDSNVTPNDLQIGTGGPPTNNGIENGTATIYLITATNPASVTALVNTNIDTAVGANTTILPTMAGVTIIDLVAFNEGNNALDVTYDGAQVFGPQGGPPPQAFIPAGIYRCGDYPGAWSSLFLDFNNIANANEPRTPGLTNTTCTVVGPPGTPFCFGDGSLATPCPCANFGTAGRGCANSLGGSPGALLVVSGTLSPDAVVLDASDMILTATNVYLQGSAVSVNGVVFGDGVRCAAGQLLRLAVKPAVAGASQYPDFGSGDLSITAKSALLGFPIAPGSMRWYQVYYRDANLGFCPTPPGNSWNATNAIEITWP